MRLAVSALVVAAAVPAAYAQGTSNAGSTSGAARVETPAVGLTTAPSTAPEAKSVVNTAGPRMESATVGVKAPSVENGAAPTPPKRAETRQNQAMMIVGFGGLIAGAIIGGDAGTIIMVGGAGLGLWGLYRYLE
jgi:hypothetical protein